MNSPQDPGQRAPPDRYTPYGEELANRVAEVLMKIGEIAYSHRDYCGTGLFYSGHDFVYDDITDGLAHSHWQMGGQRPIARFPDRAAFVAWLAKQSDESLCGREMGAAWYIDNQRITRARLEEVLAENSPGADRPPSK